MKTCGEGIQATEGATARILLALPRQAQYAARRGCVLAMATPPLRVSHQARELT
ncbi:MAG: hypothetical protein FD153_1735 [Rhodospirillaceae bacterium]|nr:MAG: hypothetical protein FD153_1735 [Rhodospirillaceae bacterium]